MNALVNDQLGRLRLLFGSSEVANWFMEQSGRPIKFARYTGRTLYPGSRREELEKKSPYAKHSERLKPIKEFYVALEEEARTDQETTELIRELKSRGKWPAKPSSDVRLDDGVSAWFGSGQWKKNGQWSRAIERPEDPELFLRHEVQDNVPDLLVTNYSMLEYMLLRPIERRIFEETAQFFKAHRDQRFILILDEAHLYKGAQGTEVAMLIRRLKQRLQLGPNQLQVICTSASFSNPEAARVFAAQLTGKSDDGIEVITGEKRAHEPSGEGLKRFAEALIATDLRAIRSEDLERRLNALRSLVDFHGPPKGDLSLQGSELGVLRARVLNAKMEVEERELSFSEKLSTLGDDILAIVGDKPKEL